MNVRARFVLRLTVLGLVAGAVSTCQDATVPTDDEGPTFLIRDGGTGHNGGNPDVFFLPPLADFDATNPNFGNVPPNPNLVPTARVCELDVPSSPTMGTVYPCKTGVATRDLTMAYNSSGGYYQANLGDAGPLNLAYYRIDMRLGTLRLNAFRDLRVLDGPPSAACTSQDFCQVNRNGQGVVNQPIKVIIEKNAACIALDPSFDPTRDICATATLNAGSPLVVPNVTAVTPDQNATLSIRSCPDLRSRGSSIADHNLGRIDLMTWGECVEINSLELSQVTGVTDLCNAPGLASASGLAEAQVERLTIHRFSVGDDFAFALGHGDATQCSQPAPSQGQAFHFTKYQQFVRAVRRGWRTATELVLPEPALACDRGCSSGGPIRSSYQVAGPAAWDYAASNPGGTIGTYDPGTPVTARAKVVDSGEFPDGSTPAPTTYTGLRVTVRHTHPNGSVTTSVVLSDNNGIVAYPFTVEAGANNVQFQAIGVGGPNGDATPVNDVQAPTMQAGATANVQLSIGTLTFTAVGRVALEFVPDPPTSDPIYTDSNGIATIPDFKVCTVPRTPGIPITDIQFIQNNGTPVSVEGLALPVSTGSTGCYTFSGITINKTGAYRIVANGQYISQKINVKPGKK